MKVQLDENLPPVLAKMLNALAEPEGHEVSHVNDLGKRGKKDKDLFAAIAKEGFQVHITLDHHHRKQVERDAIASTGLVVFVMASGWSDHTLYEQAAKLIQYWPRIIEHTLRMKPPAVFRIPWRFSGQGQFEAIRNI